MTTSAWEALPFPTRGSPFYSLKSIAFSNNAVPAASSSKPPAATGSKASVGVVLPPVLQNQSGSADLEVNRPDDKASTRHLRRRDNALEEYKKVQDQLQELLQKLSCEKESQANIYNKVREMSESLVKCNRDLQAKVAHTYAQQQQLRKLRLQVKEYKDPTFSADAAWEVPAAVAAAVAVPHGQVVDEATSSSSPARTRGPLDGSSVPDQEAATPGGTMSATAGCGAVMADSVPAVAASTAGRALAAGGTGAFGMANNANAIAPASASSTASPSTAGAGKQEHRSRPSAPDVRYARIELYKKAVLMSDL